MEQASPIPVAVAAPVSLPPQEKDKENLIEFSSNSQAPAHPQQVPADLYAAQTQNNGQQQKDLERTLQSTSTVQGQNQNSLIDFHEDLKRDLPAAAHTQATATSTLYRQDTDTNSLDEFVDAEGWFRRASERFKCDTWRIISWVSKSYFSGYWIFLLSFLLWAENEQVWRIGLALHFWGEEGSNILLERTGGRCAWHMLYMWISFFYLLWDCWMGEQMWNEFTGKLHRGLDADYWNKHKTIKTLLGSMSCNHIHMSYIAFNIFLFAFLSNLEDDNCTRASFCLICFEFPNCLKGIIDDHKTPLWLELQLNHLLATPACNRVFARYPLVWSLFLPAINSSSLSQIPTSAHQSQSFMSSYIQMSDAVHPSTFSHTTNLS